MPHIHSIEELATATEETMRQHLEHRHQSDRPGFDLHDLHVYHEGLHDGYAFARAQAAATEAELAAWAGGQPMPVLDDTLPPQEHPHGR